MHAEKEDMRMNLGNIENTLANKEKEIK